MPSIFSAAPTPRQDLSRRLRRLARVFPLEPLAQQGTAPSDVVEYYEHCFDAYRRHHSSEGAVHMALNDGGRFDPDGFYGQLRRIEQVWRDAPPQDVLELAFGQGFNLAYLAPRFPGTRFCGLDLTPRHVEHARDLLAGRGIANAELRQGDFHDLPYADASFDHLYCIEALCHATDTRRALAECARVLRPGGRIALLEVDRPASALVRFGHGVYFRRVVPLLGALLSDRAAYAYLPESTAYLPDQASLFAMLAAAGFGRSRKRTFLGGAAQLVTADRGDRDV